MLRFLAETLNEAIVEDMHAVVAREGAKHYGIFLPTNEWMQPVVLAPTFVNGEGPYDFVLDTGEGTCLIVPELAAELGIVAARTTKGMGAAGAVTIGFGAADSMVVCCELAKRHLPSRKAHTRTL